MATWEASKTVIQLGSILADGMRHQVFAPRHTVAEPTNDVLFDIGQIRVATAEQIRPRLPKHVLGAIRNDPGCSMSEDETQPASIQLPGLQTPYQRARSSSVDRWSRDEDQADDEYDERHPNHRESEQQEIRNLLVMDKRVGDFRIGQRKGVFVGRRQCDAPTKKYRYSTVC